ncbi:MAG: LytTR family DNA-binding domain-containing protein [Chitinophagaceae bacterium]
MRVIIIDDEHASTQVMEKLLTEYFPELEIISICHTFQTAVDSIKLLSPDLLFLDIELPSGTGFDILEQIENKNLNVIFTTAHSQYGIKAIQYSAVDYLLKPIDIDELVSAVTRVKRLHKNDDALQRIKLLLENIQHINENQPVKKIALPTFDGIIFLNPEDIVRCMSSNNYTYVYQKQNKELLVSKTLKEIESILSTSNFYRVHNSHLVNLNYVSKIQKGTSPMIIMSDNTQVEVSRRKKDELFTKLNLQ